MSSSTGYLIERFAIECAAKPHEGVIGLEGAVFAGKSTLAQTMCHVRNAGVVDEQMATFEFVPLVRRHWSSLTKAQKLERQSLFVDQECQRALSVIELKKSCEAIVLDRTVLSTLVYVAIQATVNFEDHPVFIETLNQFQHCMSERRIIFPQSLVILSISTKERRRRVRLEKSSRRWRGTEQLLLSGRAVQLSNNLLMKFANQLVQQGWVKCTQDETALVVGATQEACVTTRRWINEAKERLI